MGSNEGSGAECPHVPQCPHVPTFPPPPPQVVRTAPLPPHRSYLLAAHPHGIACIGIFGAFVSGGRGAWGGRGGSGGPCPGLKPTLAVLGGLFRLPLYREYAMAAGEFGGGGGFGGGLVLWGDPLRIWGGWGIGGGGHSFMGGLGALGGVWFYAGGGIWGDGGDLERFVGFGFGDGGGLLEVWLFGVLWGGVLFPIWVFWSGGNGIWGSRVKFGRLWSPG